MAKPKLDLETIGDLRAFESHVGHRIFYPMSHDAQDVLVIIASRLNRRINAPQLAVEFARQYSQASYEDAIMQYDKGTLCRLLKDHKTWNAKTDDALIQVATLTPLRNKTWSVPSVPHGFRITNSQSVLDIYDYLTQQFVINNFSKSELHHILTMSQSGANLEDIKQVCSLVKQPDKRSIAYIFAIYQSEMQKSNVRKAAAAEIEQKGNQRLKLYLDSISDKSAIKITRNDNWMDDIATTRKMYDED